MAGPERLDRALSWAPLSIASLARSGRWRTRQCGALLAGWMGLLLLCLAYGLGPSPRVLSSINLGFAVFGLFPPLIAAFVVLFWFGLEWAAVLITVASVGVGIRLGMPLPWLILFSLADAAGLTILALIYRLSRLPYTLSGPAAAVGYVMGSVLCGLVLSSGAFFLGQTRDAMAETSLHGWISWWIGGIAAAVVAAAVLNAFSARVEDWKTRHFETRGVGPVSYRTLLGGVVVGGGILGTLVLGVSEMVWQRLEVTFRSGSPKLVESNLTLLRALWLMLSEVGVLLVVALCLGGVALAWMWSRALEKASLRRAAEKERAERRFRVTFEEAPVGIGHIRPDGRFILVNAKLCEILGYSRPEMLEMSYFELVDPAEVDLARQRAARLLSGELPLLVFERAFRNRGGARVWVRTHVSLATKPDGTADYCLLVLEDIRQRKELEDRLQQTSKMEAVGRLAGGVAHDFNNLLAVILGFTEMAQVQLAKGGNPEASLMQVKRGADRAAELTRQLLMFSRRQVVDLQLNDLNAEVEVSCSLLPPLVGPAIDVRFEGAAGLPRILADRSQISQIVVNLATNARDAMPRGGTVWVRTRQEGRRVVLEVEDEGAGIPADVLPHIFEPFYTTKSRGRGTGLGLATVYTIVQQMAGEIEVRSGDERGTCFRVSVEAQEAAGPSGAPPGPGRPMAVLLAEDDPAVRNLTATSLTGAGHRVTAAESGEAALLLFQPDSFDLLVTDVRMPGMSGVELATRVREREPALPVVFVSGFSDAVQPSELPGPFLQKPFSTSRLLAVMSEVTIGRKAASSPPHSAA